MTNNYKKIHFLEYDRCDNSAFDDGTEGSNQVSRSSQKDCHLQTPIGRSGIAFETTVGSII